MAIARYIVPDVPIIPQDQGMSCWYASAQMLIQWRRDQTQSTEAAYADPSELPDTVRVYKANNGLLLSDNIALAKLLGLFPVPGQSPTPEAVASWLHMYGPIWTAGYKTNGTQQYGHVVVIVGISNDQFLIHDPEPVNVGSLLWKPLDWLDGVLDIARFAGVDNNFLHFPG